MKRAAILALAVAVSACSDITTVGDQLVGSWTLSAYDDHGEPAVISGTWTFFANANFTVHGAVTFTGEPTDSLEVIGAWREQGPSSIAMTVAGETTVWDVTLAPDTAVLVLPDPEGTLQITLTR